MSERVPETVPTPLPLEPDPSLGADTVDPPLDLHASLAAVRVLLERRGHSGLTEETVTTAPAARNPTHTAPTRHAPGTGFSTTGFSTPGFSTPGSSTPGLTVRRRESPLEAVSSKSGTFNLLHTHARSELTEIRLYKDARLALTPAGRVIETFYLISGQLGGEVGGEPCVFGQGDTIVTENLSAPLILEALTDTRLLYLTEQPQFHTFSERLGELKRLAAEVELKDGYTANHCERLQELSYRTGLALGLGAAELHRLEFGAYLHDVGKLHVPLAILNKPGTLTSDEWVVIKQHPSYGRELLDSTFMKEAGVIVEQHHERFDGSGYPFGLAGAEISVEAAIVAVADTFDAMTTDRPYRQALDAPAALGEIRRYAGTHYPKEVVGAFTDTLSATKRG